MESSKMVRSYLAKRTVEQLARTIVKSYTASILYEVMSHLRCLAVLNLSITVGCTYVSACVTLLVLRYPRRVMRSCCHGAHRRRKLYGVAKVQIERNPRSDGLPIVDTSTIVDSPCSYAKHELMRKVVPAAQFA